MPWAYLFIAGLLEVAWAIGLKASNGFARPWISALTIVGMILSFILLSQALRTLPVGTGYAIWTGIGAVGTAVLGMWFFNEPHDPLRVACIALIVIGIAGLKYFGSAS